MQERSVPVLSVLLLLCSSALLSSVRQFSVAGANGFVRSRDWNGLIRYGRAWVAREPSSALAWYYIGSAYGIGLHEPAAAARPFERAVALNPNWPLAWNALGFTYMDLKRYDDAVAAFQHCVDQAHDQSNYWNNLASAYSWAGKDNMALDTLDRQWKAVLHTATYADWYNMGNGFKNLAHPKEAASAYNNALRLNPNYGPAWNNLGVLQQQEGNYSIALNDYRRAAALGDSLGSSNASALESALSNAQQHSGGRRLTPQMIVEFVRERQAHAWLTNHPGALGTPYGHP